MFPKLNTIIFETYKQPNKVMPNHAHNHHIHIYFHHQITHTHHYHHTRFYRPPPYFHRYNPSTSTHITPPHPHHTSPSLSWRDIQHIVAETSIIASEKEGGWVVNGGGYHLNDRQGFGVLDCSGMVRAALKWTPVQESFKCVVSYQGRPRWVCLGGCLCWCW